MHLEKVFRPAGSEGMKAEKRKDKPVISVAPLPQDVLDRLLRLAVNAGRIMLESGAETYRVEDTIMAILKLSGQEAQTYVLMTGIAASIDTPSRGPQTLIRRVSNRTINLFAIHTVNQISRDISSGKITLEEAEERVDSIDRIHYPYIMKVISTPIMSGAFALLLSGILVDAVASFVNGFSLVLINYIARLTNMRSVLNNFLAGFITSLSARVVQALFFPNANYDMIIAGSLMLMFPGTAITNAIRDTLSGDYVSGGARATEAFLTATFLAIGTGVGLWISGEIMKW